MNDSYRHKGLRRQLIEEIRAKGIKDESVLDAMSILPRHFFLEKAFEEHAYADKAFPIGNDQTISQPYTVAYMTSLLDIKKGDKVLEIGTGSGYQAAVLATLGARVYTVERQEELYKKTKELLKALNFNTLRCFFGDGSVGLADYAPYDKIIVTAGAPVIPDALKEQLAIDGVLIIPVGENDGQRMYYIKRSNEIEYESKALDKFRFVPFLSGLNKMK
jgi:protein-L-isoaspartate(D-aspartate) O-methyltransferase